MKRVRSVCPLDCPDTCGLSVDIEDGKIVRVDGHPDHPVTKGAICQKVRRFPERVYHRGRILHPLRRKGPKGTLEFERISWSEAYAEIKSQFDNIISKYGPEAILPYSFYGNMGVLNAEGMDRRFFNRLGASRLERTICNSAGATGFAYTMGANAGIDPEDTIHSNLILIWGCNVISTNMHQMLLANEARKRGAKIVVIDVHRNRSAKWADWFVQIRPGSDAALALGMMHVLIRDHLVDEAFVSEYTVGFDALKAQVEAYSPERVAELTGVSPEDIESLAKLYGTTTPSFIRIGNGLQHHDNGGMIVRTIACLPALTGQWGVRGGGAIKGNSHYAVHNVAGVQRPDLLPRPLPRLVNMNQLGDVLQTADPPVKALFVYNSNPAQVAPDQNKVRTGLLRSDLFTVVHDLFPTDTCKYADIVLPATSHFENLDLYKSYWHLYLQLHKPIIEPLGESKSNFTLFKELAKVMGFTESCFDDTEEDMIRTALDYKRNPYLEGVTYEDLWEQGWVKLNIESAADGTSTGIPTPTGKKVAFYSERMERNGLVPVPTHVDLQSDDSYPLYFTTPPNHHFLNSTGANVASLTAAERRPVLQIHPIDAACRSIDTGQLVRIFNDRGEIILVAEVTTDVQPGLVLSQGLWWDDDVLGYQSVNTLTSQRIADMGGGATFFSTRVEVVKAG
ncbi:molybdopterin-containing oxidoreductase family protein [Alicyclobacillus dauci]|uniref:Molybdopterin oxidoreductase family protein n=1 Tax=Alicyclobacillus dauci TaxID=1475485 RepID=A0ABY6Z3X6_9BACL|nr:molybdopterin oxidoreductase family protein [Alicyclobacillus dauci]WAH37587.1 molybdopterin oxidoreductase family protein [Alicyclobacillus dauci]